MFAKLLVIKINLPEQPRSDTRQDGEPTLPGAITGHGDTVTFDLLHESAACFLWQLGQYVAEAAEAEHLGDWKKSDE